MPEPVDLPQPGRTMGRGMLLGSWLVGMALATMWFQERLDDTRNPNRDPASRATDAYVEVMLKKNRFDAYLVAGRINGRPVEFLVDTGASDVVVPAHLAYDLGLDAGLASRAMTANGTVEVRSTHIGSLHVGDLRLADLDGVLNPGMRDDVVLLGMSALNRVEMVHRDGTLLLRQYQP